LVCLFFSLVYSFSSAFRSILFLLSSIYLMQESVNSSHLSEQTISWKHCSIRQWTIHNKDPEWLVL
jgi:hypothetical protein